MYLSQRIRLLRETPWRSAQELAEELYAMFSGEDPVQFEEGITLQMGEDGRSPIEITDFNGDDDTPLLRLRRGDLVFDLMIDASGDLVVERSDGEGGSESSDNATDPEVATSTATFPGKVLSGTGTSYEVEIYPSGLSGDTETVTVTQLQIDASETIPADTWAMVSQQADGTYTMQVPVWL